MMTDFLKEVGTTEVARDKFFCSVVSFDSHVIVKDFVAFPS